MIEKDIKNPMVQTIGFFIGIFQPNLTYSQLFVWGDRA